MVIKQGRKEKRVNIRLPLRVTRICLDKDKSVELHKILPMETVNLSGNGVLLYSPLNLPPNVKFWIDLLIRNEVITCFISPVRKEIGEDGYYYGCKLYTFSETANYKLRHHLYASQFLMCK